MGADRREPHLLRARGGEDRGAVRLGRVFGVGLAVLGCLALVMGTNQFLRSRRGIFTGNFVSAAAPYMVIVAGSLALAGVFIIYVLLSG